MLEFLSSGLFGSLFGGLFRLAPEVLKWLDRKNERQHELKMFEQQCELEKQKGAQKLSEIGAQRDADIDIGAMSAFSAAINQQAEMVKSAKDSWVAAFSASVRPTMTYYLLIIYGCVKFSMFWQSGFRDNWTADDMALLSGVINYWMLDRTLAKRGL